MELTLNSGVTMPALGLGVELAAQARRRKQS